MLPAQVYTAAQDRRGKLDADEWCAPVGACAALTPADNVGQQTLQDKPCATRVAVSTGSAICLEASVLPNTVCLPDPRAAALTLETMCCRESTDQGVACCCKGLQQSMRQHAHGPHTCLYNLGSPGTPGLGPCAAGTWP